jgi:DNA-binding response OmpR family regulator/prefoldin subunit 5
MQILVIEPDKTSQSVLEGILSEFIVSTVTSAEQALVSIADNAPGMIIMEPELPDMDGYELCRRLRTEDRLKYAPILFLTSSSKLEDRLKAYDAGASDYLNKPFDVMEFLGKVAGLSRFLSHRQTLDNGAEVTQEMLFGVQSSASKLQSISRFIQATLFIHDFESLSYQFLKTAREIQLDCVMRIESHDGRLTRAADGQVSKLEEEILDMAGSVKRVHSFGNDRAIFHWEHATLLTRNVGEMIDIIAIFMDALEAAITALEAENRLLSMVEQLEARNVTVQHDINALYSGLNDDLKNVIISIGLVSGLDVEDEESINNVIDGYAENINDKLDSLRENSQALRRLLGEMIATPEHLKETAQEDETDEFGFF